MRKHLQNLTVIFTFVCAFHTLNAQTVSSLKRKVDSLQSIVTGLRNENNDLRKQLAGTKSECTGNLPSITYFGGSSELNEDGKKMLDVIAAKLIEKGGDCAISITGYPGSGKTAQNLCSGRIKSLQNYMFYKGISYDRVSETNCDIGGAGDANTFDIKFISR